jgi:hypothetical protein
MDASVAQPRPHGAVAGSAVRVERTIDPQAVPLRYFERYLGVVLRHNKVQINDADHPRQLIAILRH